MNTRLDDAASAAQCFDRALLCARDRRLPKGYPLPQPSAAWTAENVAFLERYRSWLLEGGASPFVVRHLYVPTAGYALGYARTPWQDLDTDHDLAPALAYVEAKGTSAEWLSMSRCALMKFRTFLRQTRGLTSGAVHLDDGDETYPPDLPAWLGEPLLRWLRLSKRNWRPARCRQLAHGFWDHHARLWRWLLAHYPIASLSDVAPAQVLAFADARLAEGIAGSTINRDILSLRGFLLYLQQAMAVPPALLRLKPLKAPDRLPRFLTDAQVRAVQQDLEGRVAATMGVAGPARRDACLDRAAFYLMWHGGLRLGEVEELRLEDLDLAGRRLTVREGKGRLDRTVYLTDIAAQALQAYLDVRGPGPSPHVFLYRNQPVHKDLLHSRIRKAGRRCGVAASPHRLRHTYATQLLNAGCGITSIQRLLGHRRLNSTMVYARVHDRTVAHDYQCAMQRVEELSHEDGPPPMSAPTVVGTPHQVQLADVVAQLAEPELPLAGRLALLERLSRLLDLPVATAGAVPSGRTPRAGRRGQPASPPQVPRQRPVGALDSRQRRAPP